MKGYIEQRLEQYSPRNKVEEKNALQEIFQEIALYALQRSGFFEHAAFCGGTALRILYGLNRFSEDLDFSLKEADAGFLLDPYVDKAAEYAKDFGLSFEASGRNKVDKAVKGRFLKQNSLGLMLDLDYLNDPREKIKIKVELDANPPEGAGFERHYHDFPIDFPLLAHDMPSLFAGKIHAVLCREPSKGRDWYDLSWYLSRQINPNLGFLKNALWQLGPWKEKTISVDSKWLKRALSNCIHDADFESLRQDVQPLLGVQERQSLEHWSADLFLSKLNKVGF
ncbi:MAG: nucleotidyl transferase AbiEii/AbiGii toxin family protein [Myxococcales bacterium]|nr:MAG: nucleotidyl transferase AbiEii/AbiGii toxin family protein [Myxococcales bacterium]